MRNASGEEGEATCGKSGNPRKPVIRVATTVPDKRIQIRLGKLKLMRGSETNIVQFDRFSFGWVIRLIAVERGEAKSLPFADQKFGFIADVSSPVRSGLLAPETLSAVSTPMLSR